MSSIWSSVDYYVQRVPVNKIELLTGKIVDHH